MEEEQTIHLTDYYHVLLTNKWTVIVSLIIMVSLVLLHNSQLIPIYRATATLIIDKERTQSPLTGQRMDYETYLSESLTFNTHFELITSRPVIERVIRGMKLDQMNRPGDKEKLEEISFLKQFISRFKKNVRLLLGKKKEELPSPEEKLAALVKVLQSMVEIENIEDTRLLNVHVLNFDPVMAKDIANALSQAYIDFNIDNRLKSSQSTLGWLTDHLYGMKKKLEDAEEEFLAYKQSAKLISMEESQRLIAQKITEFNDAYIKARNRRLELDAKLAQLGRVTKSGKDIPHLRSLIENELINDLYGQLVNAEVEFSRISKTYKSKHPKVIQVKTSIDNIGHKLRREIKKELDSLKAEREVLLTRERVLQNTMADFEKEGIEINRKELKYTILKRNVEMNQNLYDTLLSRLKETDITGNIDVSNIRVTEKANLPRFPVSPNKKRNLILGIIFGLMIGIGLSFLREYLDRTLRTEDDIQKYLDLPVLSVIPLADQAADKSSRAKPVPAKAGK
ncbi:MAG: GumC family protein [Deltaproteobacteria bacterium]|nr:GumC family protein [Deltaproteobacteria bacterium]MBW1737774.1 GumC family protein [Deltaproteobacteria bacterium]MBW1910123.1 GumC family protein [Deltaproteobacteria bacterium]MBW2032981.1 GumC family protein [Deltaproteobacteria bacterium]MBW2115662.1 GumC family protein [Deltaproteobacteria bacterium]